MKEIKEKILVLGADGFIGSNLIKSLQKEKKYQLFAFDLFCDGVSKNIHSFGSDLTMVPGNFLNKDDLKKAIQDIDYVFHFVSLTTPGSSMNDPLVDIKTNLEGTINLLEECVKAGVKRVIFASSGGAIYGNQIKDRFSEDNPTNPISPYAISKLAIEKYLEYYRIHRGLDYLILRYSNPYGPGQNLMGTQGIIPIFLNLIKTGMPITVYGAGKNIRDYIYIDDAINMTKLIFNKETEFRLYNIGSGESVSVNKVLEIIKEVTKKKIKINSKPARDADVKKVLLNSERIRTEIDYHKTTLIKEGIEKTWEWVKKKEGRA
jgi:UDP-glucose 4-epimerase